MKRAVQMGKIQNGQLVGGEDSPDEDSDDHLPHKGFMEMLKRGEVRNIGQTTNVTAAPITERITSSSPLTTSSSARKHGCASANEVTERKPGGTAANLVSVRKDEVTAPTGVSRFKSERMQI